MENQTTPMHEPSSNSKWLFLIIIVLLILVLLLGVYFVFSFGARKNSLTPSPTPMPTTTSTTQLTPVPSATPEMKTFSSLKMPNLSFQGYSLSHSNSWIEQYERDENVAKLTLTKGDYSIVITQSAMDGGMCVYTDADFTANKGVPMSDKRGKAYIDISTNGWNLRRDAEQQQGSSNGFSFCQESPQNPGSYSTLTKIGAISYTTPASPDSATLSEMDSIIESVQTL